MWPGASALPQAQAGAEPPKSLRKDLIAYFRFIQKTSTFKEMSLHVLSMVMKSFLSVPGTIIGGPVSPAHGGIVSKGYGRVKPARLA